ELPGVCSGGVGQQRLYGGRFHDGGRRRGQRDRQMGWQQLVGARFGNECRRVGGGGVRQQPVCRGLVHDGGRQRGNQHRQVEREQLVSGRFGGGRPLRAYLRGCAGGVGQRPIRGGFFLHCRRQPGQSHRQVEWE